MSLSSHNWFKYINEVRLNEGVRDIGLPEAIIDRIEETLPDAAEKAKTWMGNQWKRQLTGELDRVKTLLGVKVVRELVDNDVFEGQTGSAALQIDEKDSENLKKVKYQLQNLRKTMEGNVPLGKWKRAFGKILRNLSEAGVRSEVVENIQGIFDHALRETYEIKFYARYPQLFALLNMDPTYYEEIKSIDAVHGRDTNARHAVSEANNLAIEILSQIEDPDQVLIEFPDGSYWYDLKTYNCPLEANRMGHCGADDRASTMISLRKHEKGKKRSKSFVTVSYEEDESTIYQIKGRQNSVPPEATWHHIADLINELGVGHVHETGEHSNDPAAFDEFLRFLSDKTNAEVADNMAAKWEELEEVLNELEQDAAFDPTGEIGMVEGYGFDIPDINDFFDAHDVEPYYNSHANFRLEIDLGWRGLDVGANGDFIPLTAPKDEGGARDKDLQRIPRDSWGNDYARDFISKAGIDNFTGDLPTQGWDHNLETEYHVTMLEGMDGVFSAHLIIGAQVFNDTERDADEYGNYIAELERVNDEENTREVIARIRIALAEHNYATKTAWDQSRESLLNLEEEGAFKHFKVVFDDTSIDFIFTDDTGNAWLPVEITIPGLLLPYVPSGQDPQVFFYQRPVSHAQANLLGRSIFSAEYVSGLRSRHMWLTSDLLDAQMAQQMNYLFKQSQRRDTRQQQLPLGARYTDVPSKGLPQNVNVRFWVRAIYEEYKIRFEYTLRLIVDTSTSQEAIDQTVDMLKALDKNPQFVQAAAEELIAVKVEPTIETAEQQRALFSDSQWLASRFRLADEVWLEGANEGQSAFEAYIIILEWIKESLQQMTEPERYVAITEYLLPASQRQFPRTGGSSYITSLDYETEGSNQGKPKEFDARVRAFKRAIGGHAPESQAEGIESLTKSMRRVRMEESLEDKLQRIDNLLNEADPTYDLRIYKITVGCNVNDDIGGSEAETAAEIRGIAGVTTVRPAADFKKRITPQSEYIPFEIKFELLGAASRVKYRDEVLFPAMRAIKGLTLVDWTSIHRTNVQGTIRTVRESYAGGQYGGNFGGLGGNMAAARIHNSYPSHARETPTPTIDELVADWAEGGVQLYDRPSDTTNMAYHVMMPVSELWQYCSTYYRGDQVSFDGNYKDFVANGAQSPVYLAIGKNGRVKVTGNEDIVWFAKKAGLQEVPVFISYQRQV